MAKHKLTDTQVRKAKKPGRYFDGEGLSLLVKPSGSKSWTLKVQHNGKRKDYGLGSASKIGLAAVREKAQQYRSWIALGKDPKAELAKLSESPVPTFAEAAVERHGQIKDTFKNPKHAAQWITTLRTYAFPFIGDMQVSDIVIDDIERTLRPIWFEKPETANRVKQRIADVMDMAHLKGQRATDLPVRKIAKLLGSQAAARREKYGHFAALDYRDIPELLSRIRSAGVSVGRLALQFQLLTACRSGEIRFARWEEIDGNVWKIPGARMKAGKDHAVYLSDAALTVLDEVRAFGLHSRDDLVFVGKDCKPISDATMSKAMRLHSEGLRVLDGDRPTVHGNRASFKTWTQEQLPAMPEQVVEISLAHGEQDKVIKAYGRGEYTEKRKELMARWADFALGKADNVVRLAV